MYRASGGVHEHLDEASISELALSRVQYALPRSGIWRWYGSKEILRSRKIHGFVITNSNPVKTHVRQYLGVNDSDIRVVYNGVDHGLFNSEVRKFL